MSDQIRRLCEAHAGPVYAYLAYRLGSRAAAEALTETTLKRAVDRRVAPGDDPEGLIELLSTARDAAAERFSKAPDDGGLGIDPALADALARLAREERSVIALRFGARLGSADIARVLGLSESRVRTTLSRSLRRLRTELDRGNGGRSSRAAASTSSRHAAGDEDREQREQREA